jgi:hypothetical protein
MASSVEHKGITVHPYKNDLGCLAAGVPVKAPASAGVRQFFTLCLHHYGMVVRREGQKIKKMRCGRATKRIRANDKTATRRLTTGEIRQGCHSLSSGL